MYRHICTSIHIHNYVHTHTHVIRLSERIWAAFLQVLHINSHSKSSSTATRVSLFLSLALSLSLSLPLNDSRIFLFIRHNRSASSLKPEPAASRQEPQGKTPRPLSQDLGADAPLLRTRQTAGSQPPNVLHVVFSHITPALGRIKHRS